MPRDLFFRYPEAGYLFFLLLPFICLHLYLFVYRKRQLTRFGNQIALHELLRTRSDKKSWLNLALFCGIWIAAVLTLMGPEGNIRYPSLPSQTDLQPRLSSHQVLFLLDASSSMDIPDAGLGKTRLESAKEIGEGLMSLLRGETVSLYTFTSSLTLIVPPTLDTLFARIMLRGIQINEGEVGGTDFLKTFQELQTALAAASSYTAYSVILMSDGGDNQLEDLTGPAKTEALQAVLNAIPSPPTFPLKLYAIGIGKEKAEPIPNVRFKGAPVFSRLQPSLLQALALRGGGIYYAADNWTASELAQKIAAEMTLRSNHLKSLSSAMVPGSPALDADRQTTLYYQIPLGIGIGLLVFQILLEYPWLFVIRKK